MDKSKRFPGRNSFHPLTTKHKLFWVVLDLTFHTYSSHITKHLITSPSGNSYVFWGRVFFSNLDVSLRLVSESLKTAFLAETASNVFRSHHAGEIWRRNNHRLFSLNLCLRKTRSGRSRDYSKVIIYEKLRLQNVFSFTLRWRNFKTRQSPDWICFSVKLRQGNRLII